MSVSKARKRQLCENSKRYRLRHLEKMKAYRKTNTLRDRLNKYDLSHLEFVALWLKQDCACAVCSIPLARPHDADIDHDHKTGEVRGLLCHPCNTGLGYFHDSTAALARAIVYLETKQ